MVARYTAIPVIARVGVFRSIHAPQIVVQNVATQIKWRTFTHIVWRTNAASIRNARAWARLGGLAGLEAQLAEGLRGCGHAIKSQKRTPNYVRCHRRRRANGGPATLPAAPQLLRIIPPLSKRRYQVVRRSRGSTATALHCGNEAHK